jgi:hypothetical protein
LKDPNITNDICKKCQQNLEIIHNITGGCRMLAQDDYTHRHSQVSNTVKNWLPYLDCQKNYRCLNYKYGLQSVLQNSSYKLYYDRSITTERNIHNNRPGTVMLDKTIKEAYLIHVTIPAVTAYTET